MKAKTAETFLPCYRTGKRMETRIIKAAHTAEADDALRAKLDAQIDFDEKMVGVIHEIEPPETSCVWRGGTADKPATGTLRSQLFHPAMLPVLAGALLILGFFIWTELDRRADFPGRGSVEKIAAVAREMSGVELERAHGTAGELGDMFYMRGFEGFAVPAELAPLPVAGTRVFKQNGRPIAQLAIDRHNALLYVFHAGDFGVNLRDESGWRVFDQDGWAAAVRESDGLCTLVTFRGDTEEMEEFLKTLSR